MGTRVTSLAIYAACHDKLISCNISIEPKELETIGVFDKKSIEKAFNIGYDHGSKALDAYLEKSKG